MAKQKKEAHFIIFPVAMLVCGKNHEYIYKAEFEYYSEIDEELGLTDYLKINTLTYTDYKQRVFDAIEIIDNGSMDDLDQTIYDCIFGNKERWDNPERWW